MVALTEPWGSDSLGPAKPRYVIIKNVANNKRAQKNETLRKKGAYMRRVAPGWACGAEIKSENTLLILRRYLIWQKCWCSQFMRKDSVNVMPSPLRPRNGMPAQCPQTGTGKTLKWEAVLSLSCLCASCRWLLLSCLSRQPEYIARER